MLRWQLSEQSIYAEYLSAVLRHRVYRQRRGRNQGALVKAQARRQKLSRASFHAAVEYGLVAGERAAGSGLHTETRSERILTQRILLLLLILL